MLPLSCTCSLAREDVSYPNFGGAKAPMVVQRRLNVSTKDRRGGGGGLASAFKPRLKLRQGLPLMLEMGPVVGDSLGVNMTPR